MNKLTHLTHYLTHYFTGKTRMNTSTLHTLHTNARTCVCNYKNIIVTIHSTYVRTREYVRQVRKVRQVRSVYAGLRVDTLRAHPVNPINHSILKKYE